MGLTIKTDKIKYVFNEFMRDRERKQVVSYVFIGLGFMLLVIGILIL